MPHSAWIEIYTTYDPIEVQVVLGILAEEEIPCRARDLTVVPYPVNIGPLGEKRVAVPADEARRARQVLATAHDHGVLTSAPRDEGD